MPDWDTHREILTPPPMSGEQIDRLYYILVCGMALAFVCGCAMTYAFERMFHLC